MFDEAISVSQAGVISLGCGHGPDIVVLVVYPHTKAEHTQIVVTFTSS